jgi:long-chain acyl-CoA synthetase
MSDIKKLTLHHVLNSSTEKWGERTFVSFVDGKEISYHQFKKSVNNLTNFLKESGIIAGDKVAILSENQPNWGIAYFAITTMGAIAVPIMVEFSTIEIAHILRHSESKVILVSAKLYNKIEDIQSDTLSTQLLLDDFSIIPPNTKNDIVKEVISGGKKEFAKIKEAALKLVGIIPSEVEEDNIALILYTSGTTGHSKGVMLTHKNIVSDALSTLDMIHMDENDRMLSILPLFHTMESTLGLVVPFIKGASVTYIDKPPTAAALLPALKKVKPTVMLAVPLVIEKIYRLRILPEIKKKFLVRSLYKLPAVRKKLNHIAGGKLKQTFGGELRMFCIGGAAISADVETFLREAGFPYAIGYGLTETSPLVTGTGPENVRFRSCGKPMKWMQVKIDSPDPINGEGEILIKGPNVMKGYYKDPDKTNEVFTKDGWFKSGDLGVFDKDGFLYIKGRSKNVIIGSNGKNVYPEEIESIINENPIVLESLVLPKGDQLVARIFLNYEVIEAEHNIAKLNDHKAREIINSVLDSILLDVNAKINTFSRIHKVIEQREPFEKTPTQKIKRYLYID